MKQLSLVALGVGIAIGLAGCGQAEQTASIPAAEPIEGAYSDELRELLADSQVFTVAYAWDGVSASYIENAAIVVREGRVMSMFSTDAQSLPEDGVDITDLGQRYVLPGLINAHGHVGMADGLQTGEAVYSQQLVRDQLATYAHYGITSVVSLGDEPEQAFQVRDEMNPRAPGMSRLWVAGDVLDPSSPEEAVSAVAGAAATNPDWVKIRVDSQLGRQTAMSEPVYSQVIESSHEHDLPLASHMVTLEHAKGLMRANTDLLAHSVRDAEVDDELIDLMLQAQVCMTPTLTREVSTFVYAQEPDFFADPFFRQTVDDDVIAQLLEPEMQQNYQGQDAQYYEQALPLAMQNMVRMHEAGVGIAMGTDSGPPARFQGYFEHMEMEMMEDAGMSALDVLLSATSVAAQCMGLGDELGRLASGYWADFVVFEQDPMQGMQHLRSIEQVYIAGERFESPFGDYTR